jgi:hypothetical protein
MNTTSSLSYFFMTKQPFSALWDRAELYVSLVVPAVLRLRACWLCFCVSTATNLDARRFVRADVCFSDNAINIFGTSRTVAIAVSLTDSHRIPCAHHLLVPTLSLRLLCLYSLIEDKRRLALRLVQVKVSCCGHTYILKDSVLPSSVVWVSRFLVGSHLLCAILPAQEFGKALLPAR